MTAAAGTFAPAARRRRARGGPHPGWLILPALLLVLGFLVLPYVNIVVMSFRVPSTSAPYGPGFTLANFLRVLSDSYFLGILAQTMLLGAVTSVICLALSYPVAYHLARTRSRWRGLFYVMVLSPLLTGVVIRCYGWIVLLANNGLVNVTLRQLGLPQLPLMYNDFGVVVGLVHVFLPYMILTLVGAIGSIDPALEEAARSLGGTRRAVVTRVLLPLSLPGIQAGMVLVFVLTISAYVTPAMLGASQPRLMTPLVVQQLVDAFLWPFGAALALVLAVTGGIVVFLWFRLTSRLMRGIA